MGSALLWLTSKCVHHHWTCPMHAVHWVSDLCKVAKNHMQFVAENCPHPFPPPLHREWVVGDPRTASKHAWVWVVCVVKCNVMASVYRNIVVCLPSWWWCCTSCGLHCRSETSLSQSSLGLHVALLNWQLLDFWTVHTKIDVSVQISRVRGLN